MLTYFAVAARQMPILLKKNFILTKRNLKSTIIQLLVPFIFVLGLFILQVGLNANRGNDRSISDEPVSMPVPIAKIPRCMLGKTATQPCVTIAYTSNDVAARNLIEMVRVENDIPTSEIREFDSPDALDIFMDNNNNVTQGAYNFNISTSPGGIKTYGFALQYNQSQYQYGIGGEPLEPAYSVIAPMIYQMQRAIVKTVTGNPNFDYNVEILPFPHGALRSSDAVKTNGPSFFFAALMFNLVVQLGQIVSEKELKLRDYMSLMGLKNLVFWGSWVVTNVIMNTLSVLVLIISGYIFQFDFFLKNAFGSFFFLFFLFGISLVPFTFFFSTFIREARTATSFGFVIFLFGVILQSFSTFAFAESFYPFWRFVFSLMPFALLAKGINDIANASSGTASSGFLWENRGNNDWWSLNNTYAWLMYDFIIYFVLTWYFDNVIPNSHGVRRPPWFFLTPSYWVGSKKRKNRPSTPSTRQLKTQVEEHQDDDVVKEREDILAGNFPEAAVVVKALFKTYNAKKLGCIPNSNSFTAVAGTYWHIDPGSLFCLLGHNGAGKTTTINMMTGMFKPTSGDAEIFGYSILDEMEDIRKLMGVCPQHDILWDQLTGREHLEFFAGLRGLRRAQIRSEVEERLKDVELISAGDMVSSSYSGGMKRRLSTAIALTADPKIVFLDEPTTGMDPVSRRQVWNLIEKVKRGRVIVLTTHSMEEADVLGDRIAIMKKGRMECIGSSIRLKNKFGAGYRVTVLAPRAAHEKISSFFESHLGLPSSASTDSFLEFNVPREMQEKLPQFFKELEKVQEDLAVEDIQLSLTSLEEVFLKVAGLYE